MFVSLSTYFSVGARMLNYSRKDVVYTNTDCADNVDLHVWQEPYVWATSTGATVDTDARGYDYPWKSAQSVSSIFHFILFVFFYGTKM